MSTGGKSSDTKRSTNLSEFVRWESGKAQIQIHLWNGNSEDLDNEPYKHEEFGDVIIFERTITTSTGGNTTNTATIKGSSGFVVKSNVKEVRSRILEHFHIELNNPLTILQQEEAKNFFKRNDGKTLYEFFANGSLLNAIQITHKTTMAEIASFQAGREEDERQKERLEKEIKKLEEYQDIFITESQDKNEFQKQILWAKLNRYTLPKKEEAEKALNISKNTIQKLDDRFNGLNTSYKENKEKILKIDFDIAQVGDKLDKFEKEHGKTDDKIRKLQNEIDLTEKKIVEILSDRDNTKRTIRELDNEIREKKIDINRNRRVGFEENHEQAKESLEEELKNLQEQETKTRQEISEFGSQREELDKRNRELEQEDNILKRAIKSKEENLKRYVENAQDVRSNQNQELARFGRNMVNFVSEIESRKSQFTTPPIGPMGRYIHLSEEAAQNDKLSSLFHAQISVNFLKSFIVSCDKDCRILSDIAKHHFAKGKVPTITIRKR